MKQNILNEHLKNQSLNRFFKVGSIVCVCLFLNGSSPNINESSIVTSSIPPIAAFKLKFSNPFAKQSPKKEYIPVNQYSIDKPSEPIKHESLKKKIEELQRKNVKQYEIKKWLSDNVPFVEFEDLKVTKDEVKAIVLKDHGPVKTLQLYKKAIEKEQNDFKNAYVSLDPPLSVSTEIIDTVFDKQKKQLDIGINIYKTYENQIADTFLETDRDKLPLPLSESNITGNLVRKTWEATEQFWIDRNGNSFNSEISEIFKNPGERNLPSLKILTTIKNDPEACITDAEAKLYNNTIEKIGLTNQNSFLAISKAHIFALNSKRNSSDEEINKKLGRHLTYPFGKFEKEVIDSRANRVFLAKPFETFTEWKASNEYGVINTAKKFDYAHEDRGGSTSPDYKYVIRQASYNESLLSVLPPEYQKEVQIVKKKRSQSI